MLPCFRGNQINNNLILLSLPTSVIVDPPAITTAPRGSLLVRAALTLIPYRLIPVFRLHSNSLLMLAFITFGIPDFVIFKILIRFSTPVICHYNLITIVQIITSVLYGQISPVNPGTTIIIDEPGVINIII